MVSSIKEDKDLFLHFFFRDAYNYELSLFVVKNLCYIFMLMHSLYPGVNHLFKKICGKAKTAMKEATSSHQFPGGTTTHSVIEEAQHFELREINVRNRAVSISDGKLLLNSFLYFLTLFTFSPFDCVSI